MIPEGDPDLTTYLNEPLGTKKPEQQNNVFWFPTHENLGNPGDHIPIQTRILRGLLELKEKVKLYPQADIESRTNVPERFDRTGTLLTKAEKRAIEGVWIGYNDMTQTQNGHLDEHGDQGETHSKRQ